jgi:two-component system, NtrC family, sensor kinase
MDPGKLLARYQELQEYVGWRADDAEHVHSAAALLASAIPGLVDDFYAEIDRHPNARKVITGGRQQIERLKGTLRKWLEELLGGRYDADYVVRRWRVGWRHVEIGLDQVYTNVALSRLRTGLVRELQLRWPGSPETLREIVRSLDKLLDLDLAIIEDAYQTEYIDRQQRAERLATIGQVAGGVAHELRNPLNVVKTSVYYLMNARNLTPEKSAEHFQRIERQVALADGVIMALSNFARMPAPNRAPFMVEECVREALDSNPMPASIEVVLDIAPSLPKVLADKDQIRIVLGNLLRNAREAMPDGGKLLVRGQLTGDHVAVEVRDTGTGIAPDNLPKILEPLFSTKARGLGLGLAMARAILEKNRGTLHVASTLGQGSTFTTRLVAFLE